MRYISITLLLMCMLVNTIKAEYFLLSENDPKYDNPRQFFLKYASSMSLIEKLEFNTAVMGCYDHQHSGACLLGFFQRLSVKYRAQAVSVSVLAQILFTMLCACEMDVAGCSTPIPGFVIGMILSAMFAPFSSMRIDNLVNKLIRRRTKKD